MKKDIAILNLPRGQLLDGRAQYREALFKPSQDERIPSLVERRRENPNYSLELSLTMMKRFKNLACLLHNCATLQAFLSSRTIDCLGYVEAVESNSNFVYVSYLRVSRRTESSPAALRVLVATSLAACLLGFIYKCKATFLLSTTLDPGAVYVKYSGFSRQMLIVSI